MGLVLASKLAWLRRWSKYTIFLCGGSELTWFQCHDQNWLGFCLAVENNLFWVYVSNELGFCVWTSRSTWYSSGDRSGIDFSDGFEIGFVFVFGIGIDLDFYLVRNWLDPSAGVELELISVQGWNWFGCCVGGRNWLDFSVAMGLTCFLWDGRKRPVLESGSKFTWFFVSGHRNCLDTRVPIEIDLISVTGSKLA